jgi:VCBS repeat-containing protein
VPAGLSFDTDGTYSFDPGSNFDYLESGESATVSFTYSATSSVDGSVSTSSVTITVTGTDDLPTVSAYVESTGENTVLESAVVAEGATANGYAVAGDVPAGLSFDTDGTYSFDPGSNFDYRESGESATVSFTYSATSAVDGSVSTSTVTITVTGPDDLPTVSAYTESTGENTVLESAVVGEGATATGYAGAGDVPAGGSFDTDGTYSFEPGSNFDYLESGERATVSFTYIETSAVDGSVSTSTVTITVTGTDDLPTVSAYTESTGENTVLESAVVAEGATANGYAVAGDVPAGLSFDTDGTNANDTARDYE